MSEKVAIPSPTITSSWPTLLKISLDLSKRTISPVFRYNPLETMRDNVLCSCSQITGFDDKERKAPFLFDFPLDSRKPRFVFYDPARVKSARQLCEAATEHNTSATFLPVAQELLGNLAKICEGKATLDKKQKLGDTNLRPFRTDNLDHKSVCGELRTKICAPLNPSEAQDHGLGYIYILRSQSFDTFAELKIGFSKHHPEHRAHQLAGCLRDPEVVAHSPMIPHAHRIETIIHAELVTLRKIKFCAQCQQQHKEWFTISHIHARQVVTRWCRWVLSQPYRKGILTSEWQDHLNKQDFNRSTASDRVSRTWKEITDKFPINELMEPAAKQKASYINAIFLEKNLQSSSDLLQLPRKGNFEDLKRIARKMRDLNGGRISLPTTTQILDPDLLHLFDDVVDFRRPRPSTFKDRLASTKSNIKEAEELVEYINSIKTGCLSVCSPDLGISESPMGDATVLPVISLMELDHVDGQAKLSIGYNPTHIGFQFIQEAYERGEWEGPRPRFVGPKGPRLFGTPKSPKKHRHTILSSKSRKVARKSHSTDTHGSYRMKEHDLNPANLQEPAFAPQGPGMGSNPKKRKMQEQAPDRPDIEMPSRESTAGLKVEYSTGEDGEKSTITFSTPMTDNFINQVDMMVEKLKNGGIKERKEAERGLNQSLRYFGVETMVTSDDEWATEDGNSSSEEEILSWEGSRLSNRSNRDESVTEEGFSKKILAKWFNHS